MSNYWVITTSPENFKIDRDVIKFRFLGIPHRLRKMVQSMQRGDRVAYYIKGIQKFGATTTITGTYFYGISKVWVDEKQLWQARCPSKPKYALKDDELIDAKDLAGDLSFISDKKYWYTYFQGCLRKIPERDFALIEAHLKHKKAGGKDSTTFVRL